MKLLIVIQHRFDLWNTPDWFTEKLRETFPQLEVVALDNYDGAESHLRDADMAFTISLRPDQFAVARKLRWIHAPSAAVHQLLFPEMINSDVVITNSREVHGPVVAEHVIAMVYALARKIPQATRLQVQQRWGQQEIWEEGPRPREVTGATLGLIGIGGIGRTVARLASAVGMRVIASRENVNQPKPEGISEVFPPTALDELLCQSDFVVVAPPLTPATRGLMNAQRLSAMRKDAFLINVGRGPLVDEAALAEALRNCTIAGAALDVFDQEPLPSDSPLWGLDNLLITPHTAGLTEKLWPRHFELLSENIHRFIAGEPLLFVVDKHRGY